MSYITVYNAKSMVQSFDADSLDDIAEEIYKQDIHFFSKRERANLKGIRELFRNPEKYLLEKYVKIKREDTFKFVHPEKQPSYHTDNTCARLNSDYKNYRIPVAIEIKGKLEVEKFRQWFQEAQCALMTTIQYIKAVQLKFPYVGEINPNSIENKNSGSELKLNLTVEGIEKSIEKILQDCNTYFELNPGLWDIIRKYQQWTFLAFTYGVISHNCTGFSDADLRTFLLSYEKIFKTPTKNLLIEYYRLKFNPDLKFEGKLLDGLGFIPCQACHNKK